MTLLDDIKALLAKFSAPVTPVAAADPAAPPADTPPAPNKYKLEDGSEVEIDKLEAGGVVLVNGVPAVEGVLKLEDGTSLSVDASGVIIEVKAPEAAPPMDDEMSKFKSEFASFKQDFENHKLVFNQVQADFNEAKGTIGKQQEAITGLLQIVEQLAKTPVANPAEPAPSAFDKVETVSEKFSQIAANITALKNKS
jgi:hypothetical protein